VIKTADELMVFLAWLHERGAMNVDVQCEGMHVKAFFPTNSPHLRLDGKTDVAEIGPEQATEQQRKEDDEMKFWSAS
jgi:hypothetical protein